MKLDEHQLKVVGHLDGPALVVTDPGSGTAKVGDEVKVVVLNIFKDSKRISLSMKQTQENLMKDLLEKYPNKP